MFPNAHSSSSGGPSGGYDLIGLGELLWDCFPEGRLPGGAPANVAFHAQQLGLAAAVATRVGIDSLGDELIAFLKNQGLATDLVQRDSQHGTGTVTVSPRGTHTDYVFLENSAWDFLEQTPQWLNAFQHCRAVCFGTLAQRSAISRATIAACLSVTRPEALRVCDINLRPPFYAPDIIEASLHLANVVKLNADEARIMADMFHFADLGDLSIAQGLLDKFHLQLVCVTRGGEGAVAVTPIERCEVPGVAVDVADTVGAGDAFTAALTWSQLQGWPLERGLTLANRLGALVASRSGAMPLLVDDLATLLASL